MERRDSTQNLLKIFQFYLKKNYRIKNISGKLICLSKVHKDIGKDDDVGTVF